MVDGQAAVVRALAAVAKRRLEREVLHLLEAEHRCRDALVVALSCDERSAEGSHDARNVRADHVAVGDQLEGAQYGVIIKSTALHDNVAAQLLRGGDLHYLKERILDDRVRKAGRDVRNRCALLLRLLNPRIHENSAACAEVNRVLGKERRLGEILHRVLQRLGKGLYKGAAAGGARLVERHGVYCAVLDADALHVLSADIEDAVHLRIKIRCAVVVRNRLNLAVVELEGCLHEGLAVAGGASAGDGNVAPRHGVVELCDAADGCLNG